MWEQNEEIGIPVNESLQNSPEVTCTFEFVMGQERKDLVQMLLSSNEISAKQTSQLIGNIGHSDFIVAGVSIDFLAQVNLDNESISQLITVADSLVNHDDNDRKSKVILLLKKQEETHCPHY